MAGTGLDGPNVKAQKALIKASAEVGVKRYAPSEFGSIPGKQGEKAVIQEELTKYPQLEYTLYITGLFMDYFLGSKNTSHLKKLKVFVDPDKGQAFEVPGDGNDSLVFIKIGDAAKFVAASLDLDKWPRLGGMVGERTTYNNVIKTLEKIQGRPDIPCMCLFMLTVLGRKYPITYRSLEEMQTRTSRWDMLGLITVSGNFNNEDTLNKLLPQVKPVGLEELLSSVLG